MNGIVLSIAHSDAEFDTVLRAFDWGFHHVTHLYSAMSTVKRQNGFRIAGVLEAAYYLDGMHVVGADGAAERRYIARGGIEGDWQFVEKGLAVGERVVADGGHKVRKGMKVNPAP